MTNPKKKHIEDKSIDNSILEELKNLKKELEELRSEKRQFSDSVKSAIEEAREEMILDEDEVGPLYINERFKEDGYFYRVVDSTRPGRIDRHLRIGYEIVEDENLKVGQNTASNTSNLGASVTVELGRKESKKGILMRIPLEKYQQRQKAKARRIQETTESFIQDSVNKSDFGTIEIGNQTFKK